MVINMLINNEHHYVQFKNLNKNNNILHLFTLKPFNFRKNLVQDEDIKQQYETIANYLHTPSLYFLKPIQTHTNIVKCVTEENMHDDFDNVDGLITNLKNIALVTSLADCQGILLYDSNKKVIGNIHSGWKGTLNRIIKNAIDLMITEYHCNSKDIEAYICPSILKCCFEVDDDVKNDFVNEFEDIEISNYITLGEIKEGKQKYYIDTTMINRDILINLGLLKENIIISDLCSKCNSDIIHSHRKEGTMSGRNIAVIALK